ncbi:hypothetical protein ACSS31_27825 (plasmid) [Priestia megaterium]
MEFAKWLRKEFEFPIRVVIYLKKDYQIKNRFTKELVSATFFAPYDKEEEPYIRIATGDYMELLDELGKDEALASVLNSMAHELGHYYQWIDDEEFDEESAKDTADYMIDLYSDTRDHP